jgi:hypothetical protein
MHVAAFFEQHEQQLIRLELIMLTINQTINITNHKTPKIIPKMSQMMNKMKLTIDTSTLQMELLELSRPIELSGGYDIL